MKKYAQAVFLMVVFSMIVEGLILLQRQNAKKIYINEISSWNDYIELYNDSDKAVSLAGWHLSDDRNKLKESVLPDIVIEPGGFLVLYADGSSSEENTLPFKINNEGETIFLSDPDGTLIDSIEIPELKAHIVYARSEDGSGEWARMEASPGVTNAGCVYYRDPTLAEPVFSKKSGFYENAFELEISAEAGATIYYTLDGSEPTEEADIYTGGLYIEEASGNPNVYNSVQNVVYNWKDYEPSQELVDKAVVVRAVVIDADGNRSETATATYFVGLDQYAEADVLSIVADKEDLFGEDGIYVTGKEYDTWYLSGSAEEEPVANFKKRGKGWEIDGNIELFESGTLVLDQKVGLRIQGGSSREVAKKRFSVYARSEYTGSDFFDYEIFEGKPIHSFALRPGFVNAAVPELVQGRSVATQSARPVVVFLNGEYWYTTYLLEKYSKYYFNTEYGVDPDQFTLIQDWEVGIGEADDDQYYAELWDFFAENDFSTDQAYQKACEKIDMQSFIDFMSINIYLCNMDISEWKNYLCWRTYNDDGTEYGDGRWRWCLYDLDFVGGIDLEYYGIENQAELNSFSAPMKYTVKTLDQMSIFRALRDNEEFKMQFTLSFMDIANTNFSLDNVEKVFSKWGEDLSWHDNFFVKRFDYIVPYLADEFGLTGSLEEVCLSVNDPEAGYVQANTCIPDLSEGEWTGKYYTDYPVSLTAVANEGYHFAGWQGDVQESEESISVQLEENGIYITAVFERNEK